MGKDENLDEGQGMRWLDGITDSVDMSSSKLQEMVDRENWSAGLWGHKESDMTERLNDNIIRLDIWMNQFPIFFSLIPLAILSLLSIHIYFRIQLSIFTK